MFRNSLKYLYELSFVCPMFWLGISSPFWKAYVSEKFFERAEGYLKSCVQISCCNLLKSHVYPFLQSRCLMTQNNISQSDIRID